MSDDNQGASAPANGSSPGAITIPKERLDQEIERRRELERQVNFMQGQLSAVAQRQLVQRNPETPDPALEKLKAEQPEVYDRLVRLHRENKQVKAAFFTNADKTDRLEFIQEHGPEGRKYLEKVEQILNQERTRGNHNVSRSGIFTWLKGQERVNRENQAAVAPQGQTSQSAPSSDPSQVTGLRTSTAGKDLSKLSFDEREKELENEVF